MSYKKYVYLFPLYLCSFICCNGYALNYSQEILHKDVISPVKQTGNEDIENMRFIY
jgi:hypothetical protein